MLFDKLKHLIITLGLFGVSQLLAAQDMVADSTNINTSGNLLYAINIDTGKTADIKETGYLAPTIENILADLIYPDSSQSKRFKSITSINRLLKDKDISQTIEDALRLYSPDEDFFVQLSAEREQYALDVKKRIVSYDEFLYIKIREVTEGYLEYQFYRYDVSIDSTNNFEKNLNTKGDKFGDLPINTNATSSSIFLDIRASAKVQINLLEKALKQVFPETNIAPQVFINSNIPAIEDTIYVGLGDSLELYAQVFDNDSREELFVYNWTQVDLPRAGFPITNFRNSSITQQLVAKDTGIVKLKVQAFDGIAYSTFDSVNIKIIEKPTILLKEKDYRDINPLYTFGLNIKESLFGEDNKAFIFDGMHFGHLKSSSLKGLDFEIGFTSKTPDFFQKETDFFIKKLDSLESKDGQMADLNSIKLGGIAIDFYLADTSDLFPEDVTPGISQYFFMAIKPSPILELPSGTYPFELFTVDHGVKSAAYPILFKYSKTSWLSPEVSTGIMLPFSGQQSKQLYAFYGVNVDLLPFMYIRTGFHQGFLLSVNEQTLAWQLGIDTDLLSYFRSARTKKINFLGMSRSYYRPVRTDSTGAQMRLKKNYYDESTRMGFGLSLSRISRPFNPISDLELDSATNLIGAFYRYETSRFTYTGRVYYGIVRKNLGSVLQFESSFQVNLLRYTKYKRNLLKKKLLRGKID